MSPLFETEGKDKNNRQATLGLIFGLLSLLFSLGNFVPGGFANLGCVGVIAALVALITGMAGFLVAAKLNGLGRGRAIAGIVLGMLGLLIEIGFISLVAHSLAL